VIERKDARKDELTIMSSSDNSSSSHNDEGVLPYTHSNSMLFVILQLGFEGK
jgi:hypothetical protein